MSVVLSDRLQALADMVSVGNRIADVGCDHGFLSIYLVQKGISPKALAMDVRPGPLARAKEHIAERGLSDYIETRLSDGLRGYRRGEADTMVCAGMGGRVMTKILTESADKTKDFQELILQPQSEIPEFRRFLRREGYLVLDENILCEEGKFYFMMKVRASGGTACSEAEVTENSVPDKVEPDFSESVLYEEFGEKLLRERHLVLKEYLQYRMKTAMQIQKALIGSDKDRTKGRLQEVEKELSMLHRALAYFEL